MYIFFIYDECRPSTIYYMNILAPQLHKTREQQNMTTILNLFYIIYKYYIYTKALTKAKYGVLEAQFGPAHEAS